MYRIARLLLIVLAALAAAVSVAFAAAPSASDTHLAYVGSADPVRANYGRGNYVFDTVEFSGAALPGPSILSVGELERLAADESLQLGYQNTYSMLTSGAVFSTARLAGVKLYDLLLCLGLDESAQPSTPVRVYAADGYCVALTLAQVRESQRYNCYVAKGDPTVQEAAVPVLLSYAVDSYPLIGPTGADPVSRVFTPEEGYNAACDNAGGPIRLTIGQTSVEDYNARFNAKWVSRIVVGEGVEATHTGVYEPLASSSVTVTVFDSADPTTPLKTRAYTVEEIESVSASSLTANFFDDGSGAFYRGMDLWTFLAQKVGLPGHEGTATFRSAAGGTVSVDLAYLRNLGGDTSRYMVDKLATLLDASTALLTIDGVHPVLAFAKNGYPMVPYEGDVGYRAAGVIGEVVDNDGGPLAVLLPRDGQYLMTGAWLNNLESIDLVVDVPADIHAGDVYGDLASRQIDFTGPGMKHPSALTVGGLEERIELLRTHDYGTGGTGASGLYRGLDLLQLLRSSTLGLTVDADVVTVTGADGSSVALPLEDLRESGTPVLLAYSRAGTPLVENATSPGYQAAAENHGGPIMLASERYTVASVVSVAVGRKSGLWKHDLVPYSSYRTRALSISGSEAKGTTILSLAQLEASGYVRDSFAASGGQSAYQGVVLRKLLEGRLALGVSRPSRITVYGADGYHVDLAVDDVLNGIDSVYQPGEHREVVLAYSTNGYPLVSSSSSDGYVPSALNGYGPLRLVVENSISSWVKDVRAIVVGEGAPVYAADRVPSRAVTITSPTPRQTEAYVARGSRMRLLAILSPVRSTDTLSWRSSCPRRAAVSSTGWVTARADGRATITVRTTSGKTDTFVVYVTRRRDATSVRVAARRTLRVGSKTRLVATLTPATSTSLISWSSANTRVATVDRTGKVIARRPGRVRITVRTANGRRATCLVIVYG